MELPSNTILQNGKYKIVEKIGQGGFGIAYRAYHQGLQTEVCIKEFFYSDLCERAKDSSQVTIISASAEKIRLVDSLKKKFTKEAQRLARFQHPNIVLVTDTFDENNTAYFVMEFLDGGSLEDMIKRDGAMSEQKAKALILPIIDAMDAVHKKDLLHLDIKPANIMLRKNQTTVLIDFGISKYLEIANGNTTTAPIGISKGFAPLEQYGGSISDFSKATDIYSLCATIYNMVTGLTPTEPLQMLTNGFKSPRDLRPQLTADFNSAILKGLATKAVDRQQSMNQLKIALGETKEVAQTVAQTVIAPVEEVLKTATEFYNRAEKRRKNKEYEAAIEDYYEALKKSKVCELYYVRIGQCYWELQDYNAAIKIYTDLINFNPNQDSAYNKRGHCFNKIGKYNDACNDFFMAFELTQDNSYFYYWFEMANKSKDFVTINKYLSNEKWMNKDKVYFTRGEIYLKKGEYTKACDDYYLAYTISKNTEYLKSWRSSEDIKMLSHYLEKDLPNKGSIYFLKGKLLYEKQKNIAGAAYDLFQAYSNDKNIKYLEYWRSIENIEMKSFYLQYNLQDKDQVYYERGKLLYETKKERIKACDDFCNAYLLSKNKYYFDYWINTQDFEMLNIYLNRDLPNKDVVNAKIGDIYLKNAFEKLVEGNRNEYKELLEKSSNTGNFNAKLVSKRILIDYILLFPLLFLDIATGFLINYLIKENIWDFSDFPMIFWVILILWAVLPLISANTKATILNSKSIVFFKKLNMFVFNLIMGILVVNLIGIFVPSYKEADTIVIKILYLIPWMIPLFSLYIVFFYWVDDGLHFFSAKLFDRYSFIKSDQILKDLIK